MGFPDSDHDSTVTLFRGGICLLLFALLTPVSSVFASPLSDEIGYDYMMGFNQPSEIEIKLEKTRTDRYRRQQRHTEQLMRETTKTVQTPHTRVRLLVDRLVFDVPFGTPGKLLRTTTAFRSLAIKPTDTTGPLRTAMETTLRSKQGFGPAQTFRGLHLHQVFFQSTSPYTHNLQNGSSKNPLAPSNLAFRLRKTKPSNSTSLGLNQQTRHILEFMQETSSLRLLS